MDPLLAERLRKTEKIRELGINPFSAESFPKTISASLAKNLPLKNLEDIYPSSEQPVAVSGRLVLFRSMGKLAFGHLADESGKIQICFQKDCFQVENLAENEEFSPMKFVEKCVDLGDFLGVRGDMFETKHGEKTIFVKTLRFLSKALRPMPEKFHGLESRERCYRERNVDLMTNHETLKRFQKRSAMIREIREFFWEKSFTEVETSILQEQAGGAMARVFETHHNALDHNFVLRISLELEHKRLMGGGFERIFEIGKCFRNEGSDPSHLQEFSMCEWYAAYESLETNQQWMEELIRRICVNIFGKTIFNVLDKNDQEVEINFEQKFNSVSFADLLQQYANIDLFSISDSDLRKKARELNIENAETAGRGNLLDDIYKKTARPHLIQPTFVTDWPSDLKPLANPNGDGTSQVYQLLIAGWETVNAYGELIDPTIQRKLLEDQQKAKNAGDEEAMEVDEVFLKAMEQGFPPMTGNGFGVDRLCALLTGMPNLRDVVLFPTLKPEYREKEFFQKETKVAVAFLNSSANLEAWQKMNTVAHLSAAFAARRGKELFRFDTVESADGEKITLNIGHAIMIKTAKNSTELKTILREAREKNIDISEFTREMLETTNDTVVMKKTAEKSFAEVEHLGVLLFGEKSIVESITNPFPLYSGD